MMSANDMPACVFNHLRECIAKTPEACLCDKMPFRVYVEAVKDLFAAATSAPPPAAPVQK